MIAFFSVIVATVAMWYTRFRLEQALITLTAHIHPLTCRQSRCPPCAAKWAGSHQTHPVYPSLPTVRSSSWPSWEATQGTWPVMWRVRIPYEHHVTTRICIKCCQYRIQEQWILLNLNFCVLLEKHGRISIRPHTHMPTHPCRCSPPSCSHSYTHHSPCSRAAQLTRDTVCMCVWVCVGVCVCVCVPRYTRLFGPESNHCMISKHIIISLISIDGISKGNENNSSSSYTVQLGYSCLPEEAGTTLP